MNKLETIFSSVSPEIPFNFLILNLILTAIFSSFLGWFYLRFGQSLSNRSRLAKNFTLVATTTALVITIVKSSLALSLGLVGALSIVRFRAAIKEPEDLGFLFLAISLGLGFGANQTSITIVSFLIILGFLYLQHLFQTPNHKENLFITLKLNKKHSFHLTQITDLLAKHTSKLDLRRVDDSPTELNLGCLVEFNSAQQLEKLLSLVRKKHPQVHILMVDSFI